MTGVVSVTGGTKGRIDVVKIGGNLNGKNDGAAAGLIRTEGNIGSVTISGSVIGGAEVSGIFAGGKIGILNIGRQLSSADTTKP
jgi:hypothetical protein